MMRHDRSDGPGDLLRLQRPPGLDGAFDQGNCSKAQALVRVEPIPFEIAVELGVTVVEQEPALWRDDFETSVTLPQARPVACWQPKAHAGSAS